MELREHIENLMKRPADLDEYAKKCGTTSNYLCVHVRFANKECRKDLREKLASESGGAVSLEEVLQHFGILPRDVA